MSLPITNDVPERFEATTPGQTGPMEPQPVFVRDSYPSRILVASDGSEAAERALSRASALATAFGAELHLVVVGLISNWTHPNVLSDAQLERIGKETRERLEVEKRKLEKAGVSKVHAYHRIGKVETEILRLAEELDVGTIVMGDRGRDSLKRMLLGSDADGVVRHASCAVMVVH